MNEAADCFYAGSSWIDLISQPRCISGLRHIYPISHTQKLKDTGLFKLILAFVTLLELTSQTFFCWLNTLEAAARQPLQRLREDVVSGSEVACQVVQQDLPCDFTGNSAVVPTACKADLQVHGMST